MRIPNLDAAPMPAKKESGTDTTSAHGHQWFVMNSKDFAYYDYYTSLARCRGALSGKRYAQCFNVLKHHKKEVKDEL